MASYKLLAWRGSEGIGVNPSSDVLLVDWMYLGNGGNLAINDSAIDIGGGCSFTISKGTVGITDELATINDGTSGAIVFIRNMADITVKDGTGNIKLAGGDFYMDFSSTQCTLTLFFDGTDWLEVCRATDVS